MANEIQENAAPALGEKAWYIVTTYSKNEQKAAENLKRRIETMGMQKYILRIVVAEHAVPVLNKDGTPTGETKMENYYPGYFFVEMIMTDATWFVVRNTPNVSGITGSSGRGAKPIPIPREEIEPVLKRMNIDDPDMYSDYKVGDLVKIIIGTFADTQGVITEVLPENNEVTIQLMVFGRPQDVTCKFSEIEKVDENSED